MPDRDEQELLMISAMALQGLLAGNHYATEECPARAADLGEAFQTELAARREARRLQPVRG